MYNQIFLKNVWSATVLKVIVENYGIDRFKKWKKYQTLFDLQSFNTRFWNKVNLKVSSWSVNNVWHQRWYNSEYGVLQRTLICKRIISKCEETERIYKSTKFFSWVSGYFYVICYRTFSWLILFSCSLHLLCRRAIWFSRSFKFTVE